MLAATLRRGVRRSGAVDGGGSGGSEAPPPPARNETTRDADAAAACEVARALRRLGLTECAGTLVVRTHTRICTVHTRGRFRCLRSCVFRAALLCVISRARRAATAAATPCRASPAASGAAWPSVRTSFTPTHTHDMHDMRKRAMRAQMWRIHSRIMRHVRCVQAVRRWVPARSRGGRGSSWLTSPPAVRTHTHTKTRASVRDRNGLSFCVPFFSAPVQAWTPSRRTAW